MSRRRNCFFFFYVGRQSIWKFFFLKFEFDATLYALFVFR